MRPNKLFKFFFPVWLVVLSLFFLADIANAQEKQREVQVLYLVPTGQQAKESAERAIAAIMLIVQRHYHQQLGVTFGLKRDLVTTKQVDPGVLSAGNLTGFVKSQLQDDYLNKENLVVVVIEGSTGHGGGGWNIAKVNGDSWNDAYRAYMLNPEELHKKVLGFSHELGHALGLTHSSQTLTCLRKDPTGIPSTIMEKTADLGSVYNYSFLEEEKTILLGTYQERVVCQTRLSEKGPQGVMLTKRPHSSLFLYYSNLDNAAKPKFPPRYITLKNNGGYVAEMRVTWLVGTQTIMGQTVPKAKSLTTGKLTPATSGRVEIPNDVSGKQPITVVVSFSGGITGDFEISVPTTFTGEICYESSLSVLAPKVRACK